MRARTTALCSASFAVLLVGAACSRDPQAASRAHAAKGDQYLANKELNKAIIEYRNAVQADPRSGSAHFKLADAYVQAKDPQNAYGEFIRAADLLDRDTTAQLRAGQMNLLAGQFKEASTRADKALALDPKSIDALVLKGNALAGLKDMGAAIDEMQAAVALDPNRSGLRTNLGAIELARGNTEAAQRAFVEAVTIDPKSMAARLALANFYWGARELDKAEGALTGALAIDPRSVEANRALAMFYMQTGRRTDAEAPLKQVVDVTHDSTSRLTLADYYAVEKRTDEAIALMKAVVDSDARVGPYARARIAMILYQTGRKDEARAAIDEAIAKNPKDPMCLVTRADILTADGKLDDALASARAAVAADPKSLLATYALGRLQATRKDFAEAIKAFQQVLAQAPRLPMVQLDLARAQLASGHADEATRAADEVLRLVPNQPDAEYLKSRALLMKGDVARAQESVEHLAATQPKSAAAQAQLGTLQAMKGKSKDARDAYNRALALNPDNLQATAGLIALNLAEKQTAAALKLVTDALAKQPNDPRLLLLSARTHAATGDYSGTEAALRQAVLADPKSMDAYAGLADLYTRQNRLKEATAEMQRLLDMYPKNAGIHTAIGMLLEAQRLPDAAQKHYQEAVAIDANAAVAANNLAWLYAQKGDNLEMALQLAKTAKAAQPENAEISDTLGWIYYKKNLFALAVPALLDGVQRSPKNPLLQYHLGMAYARMGDKDKAKEALERAIALNPRFDGADEAQRTLASLKG